MKAADLRKQPRPAFENLQASGRLRAFSTTRAGGGSTGPYASLNLGLNTEDAPAVVLQNRQKMAADAGLPATQVIYMKQVHGSKIIDVDQACPGRVDGFSPECDGLLTGRPDIFLTVLTADCLAVVAADERRSVVGVAHAGWRGALQKIGLGLIEKMKKEKGCDPAEIKIGLSPCLGPCHLTLGADQYKDFCRQFSDADAFFKESADGKYQMDLWECLVQQLEQAGVSKRNIEIQKLCTFCHPEFFYSYRRDGKITGRMATVGGFVG